MELCIRDRVDERVSWVAVYELAGDFLLRVLTGILQGSGCGANVGTWAGTGRVLDVGKPACE